jgi:hypothetical protein
MFPWSLIGTALKTGAEIYKNKKKSEIIMSEARIVHAEKMKRGEIEYSGQIAQNQKSDWKDEFVLLVLSSPLAVLAYAVFAEDKDIEAKLDLYFDEIKCYALVDNWTLGFCRCGDIWNQSNRHYQN